MPLSLYDKSERREDAGNLFYQGAQKDNATTQAGTVIERREHL
jgi:hypothetical protein